MAQIMIPIIMSRFLEKHMKVSNEPLVVNELQKISFERNIIFDNGKVGENPENSLLRLEKNYHNKSGKTK